MTAWSRVGPSDAVALDAEVSTRVQLRAPPLAGRRWTGTRRSWRRGRPVLGRCVADRPLLRIRAYKRDFYP
jgi:hypothetical protein